MPFDPLRLAIRLHTLRIENRLLVKEMAERVGLPKSTLESYMRRRGATKSPGAESLLAIADTFDVSIDWLLGRTEIRAIGGAHA